MAPSTAVTTSVAPIECPMYIPMPATRVAQTIARQICGRILFKIPLTPYRTVIGVSMSESVAVRYFTDC
jgi:hypothetical protein